jgi:translocator protein
MSKTIVKQKLKSFSNQTLIIIGFIVGSIILGTSGSIFTIPNIPTWYATLNKSPLNPPGWVFGPVWTILFALMGYSAYLIWSKKSKKIDVNYPLTVFAIQFGFNIIWSFLFFGLRSPAYGLVGIIVLWFTIYATISAFKPVSKLAAWLLVPYILWVTFASYLNFMVYLLN